MSDRGEEGDVADDSDAAGPSGWPAPIRGVTESVVATRGPNDRWNLAALGLREPELDPEPGSDGGDDDGPGPVCARTWGRTRTRRNFAARGGGVVQFVTDPRTFVDAAVTVREEAEPVVASADAWARVTAERVGAGERGDAEWVDWHLRPEEAAVVGGGVRTINRGFGAVIEASVAASRLDVPAYDTAELLDRLAYLADVVERCGGARDREAFDRLSAATGWRDHRG